MIEIVFNDSACGSLKMAQHYGEGKYIGGATSVILSHKDGSAPTQEELESAQKAEEEQNRLDWNNTNTAPMGGNPQDVFGFNLILSVGDISADDFANKRQKAIDGLWNIYPDNPSDVSLNVAVELQKTLKIIRERALRGEGIRIWYSNQPDELCGLYWFMSELRPLETYLGTVFIAKLPEHEYRDDNTVVSHSSWGEISPGEWHRYIALAETTTAVFRWHCAAKWDILQAENAPLRAVINGQLIGVPETIYDYLICREIALEGVEFQEVVIVGRVLGKYRLGIGDAWIAHRIEKMIDEGKLTVVSGPAKDMPIYHRILKKNRML
ncbi:MAG: DUF3658 domain-containing protein [Oscillospiraceae bacterium]